MKRIRFTKQLIVGAVLALGAGSTGLAFYSKNAVEAPNTVGVSAVDSSLSQV